LGSKDFNNAHIPYNIVRLFLVPIFAIITFFILNSGSFFGLTIDITKIPSNVVQYFYGLIDFINGYSVRGIIDVISNIANTILNVKDTSQKNPTMKEMK
jgi:hypothetical protein